MHSISYGLGELKAPTAIAPPKNVLPDPATNVTFYPSPGNLEAYYKDLHTYILKINDMISKVKGKPCFTEQDLILWRGFRDGWVAFYTVGPSQWFTWFKDDVGKAQAFHRRALQWEAFVVGRCGVEPLPVTARPLGTPSTFADAIMALFANAGKAVGEAVQAAGAGLSQSTQRTLMYIGGGVLLLSAAYIGFRIWRG